MKKLIFSLLRVLTFDYYFQRSKKNTLLVLMFHQVNDNRTNFYPAMSVKAFSDLCQFVKAHYEVIHFSSIASHFSSSSKPAAIISFDDGHYDIMENALPILSALGMPFNVNIDTEILETGKPQDFVRVYDILNNSTIESYFHPQFMTQPILINRANPMAAENEFTALLSAHTTAKKRAITEDLKIQAGVSDTVFSKMLSKEDVLALSKQQVEFGSHSHTHSILTTIPTPQIEYELSHSKQILEHIINKEVKIIAYPNGKYNHEIEAIAESLGYTTLLQTDDEINQIRETNPKVNSYKRVNQYHQTVEDALAHTYGVTRLLSKLKG